MIRLNNVDLPAPLVPMIVILRPWLTSKVMSATARIPPKLRETALSDNAQLVVTVVVDMFNYLASAQELTRPYTVVP